ncbi:NAD(P)/FAD-dependent oxidoreductase [Nocardia asteroides]|uniref:NAD(P)/FAD-dependent oxidoreductase n=1 Tax=Nocardia asteroides TaxID=1824 RepID=UPI0037C64A50
MVSFDSPSIWTDPAYRPSAALAEDLDTEVVIIGAGYTGLAAAVALRARGVRVVAIDAAAVGAGASGRNAGHLTPTIGKDLPTLSRLYGAERTRALVTLAERAVAHVEDAIAIHDIDCDYRPVGNVLAGLHRGQQPKLSVAVEAARQAGAAVQMLSDSDIRERGLPGYVRCGYLATAGGILDPGKYLHGLRRAALEAGALLYENTPALRIEECATGVVVETPHARIRASRAVLATNAYSPGLGFLRRRITPLSVTLFATDPLTAAQREAVGWPGSEGIQTAHSALESYRLTTDGRVVGGARYVGYRYGSRIRSGVDHAVAGRLTALFRTRHPELAAVEIDRVWSGPIAMTLDFLPSIGYTSSSQRIVYSIGCTGHGIAMSSYLGTHTAAMLCEGSDAPSALTDPRRLPVPPEPLRWLGVHTITASLEIADRITDRRARRPV